MKIGIIGLGLIGGSLVRSFKRDNLAKEIVAFNRNEEPLISAFNDGNIHKYTTTIDETFQNCNIIFICTPVDKIPEYANLLSPFIDKTCILTDVGSTKNKINEDMKELKHLNFIGGHPMAGSEKTGYEHSKDYLFENAYYILTPQSDTKIEDIELLQKLIINIGAIPLILPPKDHDHIVASISHLPHVIASSLVNCVSKLDNDDKIMHLLAAGGFKDITRIASSSPEVWTSISIDNRNEILEVLDSFYQELEAFRSMLSYDDLFNFYDNAKSYRDSFISTNKVGYYNHFEIKVDALDKPGSIATIATMLSVNGINIKNIGIINNREFENGVMSITFDNQEDVEKSTELLIGMNYFVYD